MAHIKAGGVTKGNRDSVAKRLGVKLYAGQSVQPGSILVRQRGTHFRAGEGTELGGDDTIFATRKGTLSFITRKGNKFTTVAE